MAPIVPANISIPPGSIPPIGASPSIAATPGASGPAFQTVLSNTISQVESFQQNAQATINRFLNGEGEELHHVAIATQQAELSFQLFMQIRNKVVSAYQEVMRMQV